MIPITGMSAFIPPRVSLYRTFAPPAVSSPILKIVISILPTNRSRILYVASVPTRNRAWSSSLPRINRRMRCSDESSWKIFWSSFSSRVTTCLFDSSWTCCRNAVGVPRPCGLAPSARAFHRTTSLATLTTERPPCVRVLWGARSRPGCQGPQRKCAGYLYTTLR